MRIDHILLFPRIFVEVVKLLHEVGLARPRDLIETLRRFTLDVLPSALPDRKHAIGAMADHRIANRLGHTSQMAFGGVSFRQDRFACSLG
jgi:hypothetical protein